jgi:uncharacterized protein YqiB (DUF1249 family)
LNVILGDTFPDFIKKSLSPLCSYFKVKPIVIFICQEMSMSNPTTLFTKPLRVIPDLRTSQQHVILKADGFMDLSVDILNRKGNTARISIAHNYIQNGHVTPDPDMELLVDFKNQTVQAKTFQNIYIYSEVENGDDALQSELNKFLEMWLNNLIDQGHNAV